MHFASRATSTTKHQQRQQHSQPASRSDVPPSPTAQPCSAALQQHAPCTSFRVAVAALAAVTTAVPNSPALQRSPAAGPIVQQHCQCIPCPALQLDNCPALLPSTPASLASRPANLPHITGQCRGHDRAASITQCSSTVRALCNAGSSRLAASATTPPPPQNRICFSKTCFLKTKIFILLFTKRI